MKRTDVKRRRSGRREAISDAICSSRGHPSAEMVYNSLRAKFPDISLGTVYRNISMLRAEGVIKSVGIVAGEERFDGDMSSHPHFVCERCGAVMDIEEPPSASGATAAEIAAKYGVAVTRSVLTYYGECAVCAAREETSGAADGAQFTQAQAGL